MQAIKNVFSPSSSSSSLDVEETLAKLSTKEKISLLSGRDFWQTNSMPGVPSVRVSDGPNGVRGTKFFNGAPSNCFPCSTGLGSTFDVDLALEVGGALADECKAKGAHVLLAPTVNTQRSPLGGRGFESFSEDPHLNGTIASAYINGVQSKGVSACIKHYVANDAELERMSMDSVVSERALREIYLKPFELAVKHSNPWALMTGYNRLNGTHVSEDTKVLDDILRKEWAYEGTVMSDWMGTYSTTKAIKAGLDLEMPGPSVMRGEAVGRALVAQKLFMSDIDERARKVLQMVKRAQDSGIPFDAPENGVDTPELRALLRRAASDATVLLKNDKSLLPLSSSSKLSKIVVLGANAKTAVISGGGSAELNPAWTTSPLEGITAAAKELGATVEWAIGAPTHQFIPLASRYLSQNGKQGVLIEFFNEPLDAQGKPTSPCVHTVETAETKFILFDNLPEIVGMTCYLRVSATFTPDQDGPWEFGLGSITGGDVYLDGKLVVSTHQAPQGEMFFGGGTTEERGIAKDLKAGQTYALEVRSDNSRTLNAALPFSFRGGLRLGAWRSVEAEEALAQAEKLAASADIVICVVGLNGELESEGFDRKDMRLPGETDQLVARVLKANPKTIVVSQSGTPCEMPWIEDAHTLVQAFYGGSDLGNGLADVLFGKRDFSGRLPLSWPRRVQDNPSFVSFVGENGKVVYNEGVFVGYRSPTMEPLFPFGAGLSTTTFEYSDLSLPSVISADGSFTVKLSVRNTGSTAGREVVQLYISDPVSSLSRPEKELKAFAKVALAPGEKKTVSMALTRDALSFYDDRAAHWIAEKGAFEVRVGSSSVDVKLKGKVELKKTLTWTGL